MVSRIAWLYATPPLRAIVFGAPMRSIDPANQLVQAYLGLSLLAVGKVATTAALTAVQIASQFGGMYLGYIHGGAAGMIIGIAAANWVVYPAHAVVMHRSGLWQPKLDLIFLAASVSIVVFAWPSLVRH